MSGGPIFVSTGCVSADRLTAPVVRALRENGIDAPMKGLVGSLVAAEGVVSMADLTSLSSVGLVGGWETGLRSLPALARLYRRIAEFFERERPSLALLVDNPGQNLLLLRLARKHRVPVLYYVTPQEVWAARLEPSKQLARGADRIANVFDFEPPYFTRHGGNARWVGHPLLDILRDPPVVRGSGRTIALFPGSRRPEVTDLLPCLREIAETLAQSDRRLEFVVSAASEELRSFIEIGLRDWEAPVRVLRQDPYRALAEAELLITCSGTATLEATVLGLPHIVLYRVHHPLDRLLRPLVVRCRHLAMPNLLAGREVVPERIGGRVSPREVARLALDLLGDSLLRRRMLTDLEEVRARLGDEGAVLRTAEMAASLLPRTGARPPTPLARRPRRDDVNDREVVESSIGEHHS